MIQLTLVSEDLAKEENRFIYLGPQLECKGCKVKDICLNLEKGSEYRIKKLRKPTHDCDMIEGLVHVVEVEKVSRKAVVEKKIAIEGSKISFQPSECGQVGCPHFYECNPTGVDAGTKVSIETVGEKAECPIGQSRTLVTIM